MGVFACLLFGIIGAWISRSLLANAASSRIKTVLIIGLAGGFMGLSGIIFGWGNAKSFNLYNVLLSIAFSSVLTFLFNKHQERPSLPE